MSDSTRTRSGFALLAASLLASVALSGCVYRHHSHYGSSESSRTTVVVEHGHDTSTRSTA